MDEPWPYSKQPYLDIATAPPAVSGAFHDKDAAGDY
jgi:hypothetical protein